MNTEEAKMRENTN